MRPLEAVTRRALRTGRARDLSFAALFLLVAYGVSAGYRHSYPTHHARVVFAGTFTDDKTARLFYGTPHDLATVGGYAGWRVAGLGAVVASIWALVAAIRSLRGEEDAGRAEIVLAGELSRGGAFAANLAALGAAAAGLWLALFAGLLVANLPVGGSAYLALAALAPAPLFAGVGMLVSQATPTRRLALQLGGGMLLVAFVLRVLADTISSVDWMRWVTPLGWAEELRPFAGSRPSMLLPLLAAGALALGAAAAVAVRRELGSSLLRASDAAPPRMALLSSPTAQALRADLGTLAAWALGIGFFALIFGLSSTEFNADNISHSAERQLHKLGGASLVTAKGALSFYFIFFALAFGLFMCSQVAGVRRAEADQELDTLLALPFGRRRWLYGRLALALFAVTTLALVAAVFAWAGAAARGADVSFADLVAAAANCLPAAALFLALGALAIALAPRAGVGLIYGLVSVAFVWQLFGALVGAPTAALALSPFHDIGLVPAEPFALVGALVMAALAVLSLAAALRVFEARDLAGR